MTITITGLRVALYLPQCQSPILVQLVLVSLLHSDSQVSEISLADRSLWPPAKLNCSMRADTVPCFHSLVPMQALGVGGKKRAWYMDCTRMLKMVTSHTIVSAFMNLAHAYAMLSFQCSATYAESLG